MSARMSTAHRVACLLGCEEVRRADHKSFLRDPQRVRIRPFVLHQPREAEIDEFDHSRAGHEDVARLDVAVNQSLLERVLEAERRLTDILARLVNRQRPAVADQLGQVGPIHELHLVVVDVADAVGVEHLHHVRVFHFPEGLNLLLEPRLRGRVFQLLLTDDLERHVAAHARVVGLEHAPHPALTEQVEENVPAEFQLAPAAPEDFLDLERREPPRRLTSRASAWTSGRFDRSTPTIPGAAAAGAARYPGYGRRRWPSDRRRYSSSDHRRHWTREWLPVVVARPRRRKKEGVPFVRGSRSGMLTVNAIGATPMPTITVNAEPKTLPDPLTVADLLRHLGKDPRKLAVEVNRNVVPRIDHVTRRLADGDAVEIVTLVGGGSVALDPPMDKPLWKVGGFIFKSRLFTGTGKYTSYELMQQCMDASGCEVTTVAVRRERLVDKQRPKPARLPRSQAAHDPSRTRRAASAPKTPFAMRASPANCSRTWTTRGPTG